jgi:hypothetical protein
MLPRGRVRKLLPLTEYGRVSIPADNLSAAFVRIGCSPDHIDALDVVTASADCLDADFPVPPSLDGLYVAIDVAIAANQEIADFVAGFVLCNPLPVTDDLIWLAKETLIPAHPADIAE